MSDGLGAIAIGLILIGLVSAMAWSQNHAVKRAAKCSQAGGEYRVSDALCLKPGAVIEVTD